jgi:hypothetical protein
LAAKKYDTLITDGAINDAIDAIRPIISQFRGRLHKLTVIEKLFISYSIL